MNGRVELMGEGNYVTESSVGRFLFAAAGVVLRNRNRAVVTTSSGVGKSPPPLAAVSPGPGGKSWLERVPMIPTIIDQNHG